MKKKLISASIAGVLSIGVISNANADLITFDGLAGTYMPGEDLFRHDSFVTVFTNSSAANIDGFKFAGSGTNLNSYYTA